MHDIMQTNEALIAELREQIVSANRRAIHAFDDADSAARQLRAIGRRPNLTASAIRFAYEKSRAAADECAIRHDYVRWLCQRYARLTGVECQPERRRAPAPIATPKADAAAQRPAEIPGFDVIDMASDACVEPEPVVESVVVRRSTRAQRPSMRLFDYDDACVKRAKHAVN